MSVGIVDGVPVLDLPYVEDVRAETDMNVVVTGSGTFVEVQGTAEHAPFDRAELDALLDLAVAGTAQLTALQVAALASAPGDGSATRLGSGERAASSSRRTTPTRSASCARSSRRCCPGWTRRRWSAPATSALPSRSRTA